MYKIYSRNTITDSRGPFAIKKKCIILLLLRILPVPRTTAASLSLKCMVY
jgi:hypothetical protein